MGYGKKYYSENKFRVSAVHKNGGRTVLRFKDKKEADQYKKSVLDKGGWKYKDLGEHNPKKRVQRRNDMFSIGIPKIRW
jgi:hypothetical protein